MLRFEQPDKVHMYKMAYRYGEVVFYFDGAGNKYVATGGSLSWRTNNPGLVRSHCHFVSQYRGIGHYGPYAIFPNPQKGHEALTAWLHSKKYYTSNLKTIAEHYQPNAVEKFVGQLSSLTSISPTTKVYSLNKIEFERLLLAIEKLCGYISQGNESFFLIPKLMAKIENSKNKEDTYLAEDHSVLSKEEAIERILSHRLDGVIVHENNGGIHLRSRPCHCIWNLKMHEAELQPSQGQIETLVRIVGEKREGQCVWGFINGIGNSKIEALESASRISAAADGERVFSMPNDAILWGIGNFLICIGLKIALDTFIVKWAVEFLRYLFKMAEQENPVAPVILFVHSQGAIIAEHALELLHQSERERLRIFTFGGGSFLLPDASHPDTHNYVSTADFVPLLGSPNHQHLALQRYHGYKQGLNDQQIICQLATQDAIFYLDSTDARTMEKYIDERTRHYEREFDKIKNITVLDPDPDSKIKHRFSSRCYQTTIKTIVSRYQRLEQMAEI